VLADYVDGGGGVVVAVFSFYNPTHSLGLDGRISSANYLPFTQPGGQTGGNGLTMVIDDAQHPIMAGVTTFNGGTSSYSHALAMQTGSTLVAS